MSPEYMTQLIEMLGGLGQNATIGFVAYLIMVSLGKVLTAGVFFSLFWLSYKAFRYKVDSDTKERNNSRQLERIAKAYKNSSYLFPEEADEICRILRLNTPKGWKEL